MTGEPGRKGDPRLALLSLVGDFKRAVLLTAGLEHARATAGIVRRFLWDACMTRMRTITPAAIQCYLTGLTQAGRSAKTLLNHRSAISRFCRFLIGRGFLSVNPAPAVAVRRPEEHLPRFLDAGEVRQVLRLARKNGLFPEVCLALATGLRRSELMRLEWAHVDLGRQCLTVLKSKSRRPRVVPLARCAVVALRVQRRRTGRYRYVFPARQTWPGGWRYIDRPRSRSTWRRILRPLQDAVPKFRSLPGCSTGRGWHLLRHTFASGKAQAGVSLYKLAQWLGHSDVRTTRIYAHLLDGYDPDIEAGGPL